MKKILIPLFLCILFAFPTSIICEEVIYSGGEVGVFLMDGNLGKKVFVDMSSRTKKLQFDDGKEFEKYDVWMLNFISLEWNFPDEREKLAAETDTIFLKDGNIIYDNVIDFSSERKFFQFKDNAEIHLSKIKRIYFCCTRFPETYQKKLAEKKPVVRKVIKRGKVKEEQNTDQ